MRKGYFVVFIGVMIFALGCGGGGGGAGGPAVPSTPQNLILIEAHHNWVKISWRDASDNEAGFIIERKPWLGTWAEIDRVGTNRTEYEDYGVQPDNRYVYRVKAFNLSGSSGYSNELIVDTLPAPPPPPNPPENLRAISVTTNRVDLQWDDKSDNEEGFILERRREGGNYAELASLPANTNYFADTTVEEGTRYYYRVKAFGVGGNSEYSSELVIDVPLPPPPPPHAPSNLSIMDITSDRVILSWDDNSDNEEGFRIERKKSGESFSQIGETSRDRILYTDATVEPQTTYTYRVYAYNRGGESGYSNEVSGTTPAPPPGPPRAPASLTATAISGYEVQLQWQDQSTNEDGFRLERRTGPNTVQWQVGRNITTYTDNTAQPDTQYTYRVIAFNTFGDSPPSNEASVFTPTVPPDTPPGFQDVTASALIQGGGRGSWVDYDKDGDLDLFNGTLWKNNGDGTFSNASAEAGLSGGDHATWGDFDNDGWVDVFIAGPDVLFKNNGNGTFTDVTGASGIFDENATEGAAWGDCDSDGDLDLYLVNYETWGNPPVFYPDKLFRNNGNGTFTEITSAAGIQDNNPPRPGRAVTWADFDLDGDLDIYVSNYRLTANYLWQNNGNCTFTDVAGNKGVAGRSEVRDGYTWYGHTIGSSWGDFNNDGYFDLFSSTLHHLAPMPDGNPFPGDTDNNLWRNDGPSPYTFSDVTPISGIVFRECHASANWGDYDNDGYLDLLDTTLFYQNGCDRGGKVSLYRNNQGVNFTDYASSAGITAQNTYSAAWGDFNNDGFLDLYVGGKLYQNNRNKNHWLIVKLRGTISNRSAIGARVVVTIGSKKLMRQVESATGAANQNMLWLHFGLGSRTIIDSLEVFWPSGRKTTQQNISADQILTITE